MSFRRKKTNTPAGHTRGNNVWDDEYTTYPRTGEDLKAALKVAWLSGWNTAPQIAAVLGVDEMLKGRTGHCYPRTPGDEQAARQAEAFGAYKAVVTGIGDMAIEGVPGNTRSTAGPQDSIPQDCARE
ncbi:hypothetical protein IPL85_02680 [Candidatus Saccharibacteria bacterium]|nr:MAG: hypothetical protein IPL85_02680 [Candidatus Saccharibacteria bacterium]